jgi:hypothetical protein
MGTCSHIIWTGCPHDHSGFPLYMVCHCETYATTLFSHKLLLRRGMLELPWTYEIEDTMEDSKNG